MGALYLREALIGVSRPRHRAAGPVTSLHAAGARICRSVPRGKTQRGSPAGVILAKGLAARKWRRALARLEQQFETAGCYWVSRVVAAAVLAPAPAPQASQKSLPYDSSFPAAASRESRRAGQSSGSTRREAGALRSMRHLGSAPSSPRR